MPRSGGNTAWLGPVGGGDGRHDAGPLRTAAGGLRRLSAAVRQLGSTVVAAGRLTVPRIAARRVDALPHLVWQSREFGQWCRAGPQWRAYTGQTSEASRAGGWLEAIHAEDRAASEAAWRDAAGTGLLEIEHRIRRHDGTYRWFQTRAHPLPTEAGFGTGRLWIGTSTDVDRLHGALERFRHLAFHDFLTGAGNRALLEEALARMTDPGATPCPFAVLYIDIDEFKRLNDRLGHHGGDEILRRVCRRLVDSAGAGDLVARIGGDEFVLVQAGARRRDSIVLADRIGSDMARPFAVLGHELEVAASIGIACFPEDGTTGAELLRRADFALYAAKIERSDGRPGVRKPSGHGCGDDPLPRLRSERLAES